MNMARGGFWAVLAWLVLAAGAAPADTLTVATYNVQNYNLTDRIVEGGFRPAYPKPEDEKAALRAMIAALDADVIALQEVGGEPFLRELRRDLAGEGVNYPHVAAMFGADEQRGLGVISRVPLGVVTAHRDLLAKRRGAEEAEPVRRGLLEVEDPAAEDQRVAEAQAVRDRILLRFPDPAQARFVILGDCNDTPGSRALQALEARGRTVISRWVDAMDERGQRWTHVYTRPAVYSRFDQAFVSPGLWDGKSDTATARIVGEPWKTVSKASDHRPLVLTLRTAE
jgi:endonuclease/exonuclease/phosphatase family metal-dependent hydrolase